MRPVESNSEGSRTSIRSVEGWGVEARDWIFAVVSAWVFIGLWWLFDDGGGRGGKD